MENWIKNTVLTRCFNEKDKQPLKQLETKITKTAKQLQDEGQNQGYLSKSCINHFLKLIILVLSILILKSRLSNIVFSQNLSEIRDLLLWRTANLQWSD